MSLLQEKVVLVTGSSRGIGRAVAEALAEQGATVVLTARSQADLEQVAQAIWETGGQALPIAGNITEEAFVEHLFETIRGRFGRLDVLVNNAGIAPMGGIEELPVEDLRECLELNVVAAFMCMQQAVRLMKAVNLAGRIINIGSVHSHWTGGGDSGAYTASKFALRAMTESVARQLQAGGAGITVSLVCPGPVDTTVRSPEQAAAPDRLAPAVVAQAVLHAILAPDGVNIFDTVLFAATQQPW